jgi:hypothetical protein
MHRANVRLEGDLVAGHAVNAAREMHAPVEKNEKRTAERERIADDAAVKTHDIIEFPRETSHHPFPNSLRVHALNVSSPSA